MRRVACSVEAILGRAQAPDYSQRETHVCMKPPDLAQSRHMFQMAPAGKPGAGRVSLRSPVQRACAVFRLRVVSANVLNVHVCCIADAMMPTLTARANTAAWVAVL